jgi:4-aminobutyrate aminotransferase-like enzyme/Ser/Thr protein kinase RdoA (MazF antagonist)
MQAPPRFASASAPRPALDLGTAAHLLEQHWGITGALRELGSQQDRNVAVDARYVLKVAHAAASRDQIDAQHAAARHLAARLPGIDVPLPVLARDGRDVVEVDLPSGRHACRVLPFLQGDLLAEVAVLDAEDLRTLGGFLGRVTAALADLEHPGAAHRSQWDLRLTAELVGELAPDLPAGIADRVRAAVASVAETVDALRHRVPEQICHADAHDGNVLCRQERGRPVLTGLIDFGDLVRTWRIADLAIAGAAVVGRNLEDPLPALAALARGFDAEVPLSDAEVDLLWPAVVWRAAGDACATAFGRLHDPANAYTAGTIEPLLATLAAVTRTDPQEAGAVLASRLLVQRERRGGPDLLQRRRAVLGSAQAHYYDDPPEIVRGQGALLYDAAGRAYLDMVNNVTVVGHAHPAITEAVRAQLDRVNTNSRFLYEPLVAYAERLVALLPDPLDTVFVVNSGSEANELALRLARVATGAMHVLHLDDSYHGWTAATAVLSGELAEARDGTLPGVELAVPVTSPNTYRGPHRGADAAERYLGELARRLDALADDGHRPAALIAESLLGNAGGIELPDGYLRGAYAAVRAAGGMCIADEVQVGYARTGDHFWGFAAHGVVPDVVTVAKAAGNGYPLGAVITTRAIADAYAERAYFFSSAGGSPAGCAAGIAVLDVIEREGLQASAREVGGLLRSGLEALAAQHLLVGAVHGRGLYLGLELVRDRGNREPAREETLALCERMREAGVIVQPTSVHGNVLKIKPPLVLTAEQAGTFLERLDAALAETDQRSS